MEWQQERPPWCPRPDCQYRLSSQAVLCFGELPEPLPHGDGWNTHRMCIHGAPDDGEWTFELEINKGDGHGFYRLLKGLFGFGQTAAAPPLTDADIERAVHAACAEQYPYSHCLYSVKALSGTTCGCSLPKGIRAAIDALQAGDTHGSAAT